MGQDALGLIHYNARLPHQVEHALAFSQCGFRPTVDPAEPAEGYHVVSGPWHAYNHWVGKPGVLMIDRAWWGDPDCVSIGWLRPDGTRMFAGGKDPRPRPDPRPWKTREQSALILADYGQDVSQLVPQAKQRFHCVRVRRHPAENKSQASLASQLALSDVAIGFSGTALFDAVIAGVPSICLNPENEVAPVCAQSLEAELFRGDRGQWLHEMSYKQFTLREVAQGHAWSLLKDALHR